MSAEQRYLPKVRIVTEVPEGRIATGKEDSVWIDGVLWPTTRYKVEGSVNDAQRVTLEFFADVNIERREPREP